MEKIKRSIYADKIMTGVFYIVAGFFLALLIAFASYVILNGLLGAESYMFSFDRNGLMNQLFDTIYIVLLSLLISTPLGVLAGIYLAEYAQPGKVNDSIRICIETLSSLPSIVVGLFGALVFLPLTGMSKSILAGALTISILNLPLITSTTTDALRALPAHYRQGSFGLGATKWQTVSKVLIPACLARIVTGIILAAGRGFGETAALLFTSGMTNNIRWNDWNFASPFCALNVFRTSQTLSLLIWDAKSNNMEAEANLAAAILMILVLTFNLGVRRMVKNMDKKMGGKEK